MFGVQRENFGDLNVRIVRADGLERPANFGRRIRLHVPGIDLAGRAQIENHDARTFIVSLWRRAHGLECRELCQRQPDGAERADLEEIAARDAVASRDRTVAGEFEHTFIDATSDKNLWASL